MRRIGVGLAGAIAGYALLAVAGYWLTGLLSSNVHDRSVEAAMTSAFVWGPLGAVTGFVTGFVYAGRRARDTGR
jgi:hypothetical protein